MIVDLNNGSVIAAAPRSAIAFAERLRGMIGRRFSPEMDAMIFPRCSSVHSCFMKISIDLIFADDAFRVTGLRENFHPWSWPCISGKAAMVIELPAGTIRKHAVKEGDVLQINNVPDKETTVRKNGTASALSNAEVVCCKEDTP